MNFPRVRDASGTYRPDVTYVHRRAGVLEKQVVGTYIRDSICPPDAPKELDQGQDESMLNHSSVSRAAGVLWEKCGPLLDGICPASMRRTGSAVFMSRPGSRLKVDGAILVTRVILSDDIRPYPHEPRQQEGPSGPAVSPAGHDPSESAHTPCSHGGWCAGVRSRRWRRYDRKVSGCSHQ